MEDSLFRLDKHLWPIGAAIVTLLTGAWLMLAPFALGYQGYGVPWVPQTVNQFWLGFGVIVLSAVALAIFVWRLIVTLREAQIISPARAGQPARQSSQGNQPMGQPVPSGWSASTGEPARPAYMAPPQPTPHQPAPWAPPAPRQPVPSQPVPSQPAPYAQSWPPQPPQAEWQAPPQPGAARATSPSAPAAPSPAAPSPASPYPDWSPLQPSAPPVPSPARAESAPPSRIPPAAGQPPSAQASYAQGATARAEEAPAPELPAWLQPAPPASAPAGGPPAGGPPAGESANVPANEFDRAMAMLAQSLARDLAARQRNSAPAGESGPVQPPNQPNQQATYQQPNQQEAVR